MIAHTTGIPLLAVHIMDGILPWDWLAGGWLLAALLTFLGGWRMRDEDIARTAQLTACFFVASLVHVRLPGTSVHLLLNGLLGVILGRQAALAIPVGLLLQAILVGHGGITTLGVNCCIMVIPALAAWQLFRFLPVHHAPRREGRGRFLFALAVFVLLESAIFSLVILLSHGPSEALIQNILLSLQSIVVWPRLESNTPIRTAVAITFHPVILLIAVLMAGFVLILCRKLRNLEAFAMGFLVGELAVLTTTLLNCLVLTWAGQENWVTLAQVVFLAHIPIALVEGIICGFAVRLLLRVRPQMLQG